MRRRTRRLPARIRPLGCRFVTKGSSHSPNNNLLEKEIRTWERRRTESGARIRWMFSTEQALAKMVKSYPKPTLNES